MAICPHAIAALFSYSLTPFIQLEHDDVLWCIGVYADGAQAIVLSDLEQEVLLIAGGPGRDSLLLFKEIRLFRGLPNLRPTRFLCSGNARACCRERGYALR